MLKTKVTKQLFKGKYPFAIKLKLIGLFYFTSIQKIEEFEKNILEYYATNDPIWCAYFHNRSSEEEVNHTKLVINYLKNLINYDVRVEIPFLTIYTHSETILNNIINLVPKNVHQISKPPINMLLKPNEIYSPTIPFEYKVNIRGNKQDNSSFLEWARESPNVQLTEGCRFDLSRQLPHGSYFYVSGDDNLFLAKLYLGSQIKQILKIVH